MADTIINTPQPAPQNSGSGGWAVAVIILILVIVGGFVWYRYYRGSRSTTYININTPIPVNTN